MRKWLTRLLFVAASIGVLVFLFGVFVARPYNVDTASMEPTLKCSRPTEGCTEDKDEHVIVLRLVYRLRSPHRGDIVAFHAPSLAARICGTDGPVVKRIVGMPGDIVDYRHGKVSIDGRVLDEPYVPAKLRGGPMGEWQVPNGFYFMMGDNRAASCDSRVWGPIPRRQLIGRVVATYWPIHRISTH